MAITDYKIESEDFNSKDIVGLPDKPSEVGISAEKLKERFDAPTKVVVVPKFNALIDLLAGNMGAFNIGATQLPNIAGYNVQDILVSLLELINTKQSTAQSNIDVGKKFDTTEAQSLIKTVSFDKNTGKITFTSYGGTATVIDTAMEKIALDVKLDGQQFVLTLVDGSEQRVDLSEFITETEVADSDSITLTIVNNKIVATVKKGSVTSAMLASDVTAFIKAFQDNAAASAASAATSETNALLSANSAETSNQNAIACQKAACECATEAEDAKTIAVQSADSASRDASTASGAAERAERAAAKAEQIAGGDVMTSTVYDPNGKKQDIFKYTDDALAAAKKYVDDKKIDNTPTQGSGNAVSSGAVYDGLNGKADRTLSNLTDKAAARKNLGITVEANVNMVFNVTEDGILQITYDEETEG